MISIIKSHEKILKRFLVTTQYLNLCYGGAKYKFKFLKKTNLNNVLKHSYILPLSNIL